MNWRDVQFSTVRSVILFIAGLAGIAHQTLVAPTESPTLLVMFGAMIGLPAFLNKDEQRDKTPPPPPTPPPAGTQGEDDKK